MRRRRLIAIALAWTAFAPAAAAQAAPDPAAAPAGFYRLDPERASLRVTMPVLGGLYRYVLGFRRLTGGFAHDPANWRAARVTIDVDPRSAEGDPPGVARAVVEDLEPARFPALRFQSRRLELGADGRGTLSGDLTMHGVTRPIVLDVVFQGLRDGGAEPRLGFTGSGRVRRSDFGLTVGRPFAADVATLVFDVEFVRK